MRKFLTLLQVQLKSGAISATDGTTKQWKKILLYVFLFVCFLPTLGMLWAAFYYGFDYLQAIDQSGYLMNIGFMITCFVIFLFLPFRSFIISARISIICWFFRYDRKSSWDPSWPSASFSNICSRQRS